jgi:hypothetical protein
MFLHSDPNKILTHTGPPGGTGNMDMPKVLPQEPDDGTRLSHGLILKTIKRGKLGIEESDGKSRCRQ